MDGQPLLRIEDLHISFPAPRGDVQAVRGVSFAVAPGEIFGIVGESGCGKTVTGRSILGLIPGSGQITGGRILFRGEDLTAMPRRELQQLRGNRIGMIFQDPSAALNPLFTIEQQIVGILRRHGSRKRDSLQNTAFNLLEDLGLPHPESLLNSYPHQLSGGMQQRVMIAMALAGEPDLIVADEPTTALDVTIQAQILDLLVTLKEERGVTIILITHDLGVVAETCERLAVFYLGQIVEQGATREIFSHPRHPYTQGLLAALPAPDASQDALKVIPGSVSNLDAGLPGCSFAPRCEHRMNRCDRMAPALIPLAGRQSVACFLYDEMEQAR